MHGVDRRRIGAHRMDGWKIVRRFGGDQSSRGRKSCGGTRAGVEARSGALLRRSETTFRTLVNSYGAGFVAQLFELDKELVDGRAAQAHVALGGGVLDGAK